MSVLPATLTVETETIRFKILGNVFGIAQFKALISVSNVIFMCNVHFNFFAVFLNVITQSVFNNICQTLHL